MFNKVPSLLSCGKQQSPAESWHLPRIPPRMQLLPLVIKQLCTPPQSATESLELLELYTQGQSLIRCGAVLKKKL